MHRLAFSVGMFTWLLLFPTATLLAGGAKGKMFNLPDPATNEVKAITDGTVNIRVTQFGTDTLIPIRDLEGKTIPPVTRDGQVRVTGPDFVFTLPDSVSPDGRQAVTIQFFRAGVQARQLTQILQAVIIDNKKFVENLDVSVPLPDEMGRMHRDPSGCLESACEVCPGHRKLFSRLFGR